MPKTKISEFDVDPANNTDINSINIAEGCAPSGINNAIRQLMSDLKEFQTGAGGDPFNGAVNGTVGATTPNTGAFTSLSASGAFSANGGATLGDASGDALTINSSAVSIPNGLNFGSNNLVLSSGNVGIGTSSPTGGFKLDIQSANAQVRTESTTGTNDVQHRLINTGGTFRFAIDSSTGAIFGAAYAAAVWYSGNYPMLFATNNTERMRIDSSGNVGIGTSAGVTTVSSGLAINNATAGNYPGLEIQTAGVTRFYINANNAASYISSQSTNPMVFQTNGTERMRIDSSGNLLVGTSTPNSSERIYGFTNSSQNVIGGRLGASGSSATVFLATSATGASNFDYFGAYNGVGTKIAGITNAGTFQSATNTYGGTSDERLKENITDATPKLNDLLRVRIRNFNFKTDEQKLKQIGVIAQELEEVFPALVEDTPTWNERNESTGTVKNVKYSVFVPMLIKAIQEQQAIITDLKSRVEALENK